MWTEWRGGYDPVTGRDFFSALRRGLCENKAAMMSLQVLFAKKEIFFDLLEASAQEAQTSVQALIRIIQEPGKVPLEEFAQSRRKDKRITKEITEELAKTFVTPFDREDIEALSNVLYKIPKTVEKFAQRLIIGGPLTAGMDFKRHIAMLEQATETVVSMVKDLRQHAKMERIGEKNATLQRLEGEADDLMLELLCELYGGKYPPLQALLLKDLYELLEKIIDRCRDAGNVISHVALKHS
jgi:uncharacterized protein